MPAGAADAHVFDPTRHPYALDAAYRPPHADANRFVARLLAEGGPGRRVWGSDGPFLRTGRRVDYGPMLARLAAWVPDARQRPRILVDTPAELFGFG